MVREFTAWKLHTEESKDVLSLIYEGTAESFPAFLEKRLQERKEEAVFNNFCIDVEAKLCKYARHEYFPLVMLRAPPTLQELEALPPSKLRHLEKRFNSCRSDRFISEEMILRKNREALKLATLKSATALKLLSKSANIFTRNGMGVVDMIAAVVVQLWVACLTKLPMHKRRLYTIDFDNSRIFSRQSVWAADCRLPPLSTISLHAEIYSCCNQPGYHELGGEKLRGVPGISCLNLEVCAASTSPHSHAHTPLSSTLPHNHLPLSLPPVRKAVRAVHGLHHAQARLPPPHHAAGSDGPVRRVWRPAVPHRSLALHLRAVADTYDKT